MTAASLSSDFQSTRHGRDIAASDSQSMAHDLDIVIERYSQAAS